MNEPEFFAELPPLSGAFEVPAAETADFEDEMRSGRPIRRMAPVVRRVPPSPPSPRFAAARRPAPFAGVRPASFGGMGQMLPFGGLRPPLFGGMRSAPFGRVRPAWPALAGGVLLGPPFAPSFASWGPTPVFDADDFDPPDATVDAADGEPAAPTGVPAAASADDTAAAGEFEFELPSRSGCNCARCGSAANSRSSALRQDGDFEAAAFEIGPATTRRSPAPGCAAYAAGEVQRSRSAQGHLPADVIDHPRGLLIADFGVDWRTPREALKKDAALRRWLSTMLALVQSNPATAIRIVGYSDCVGSERNNLALRQGRAIRVARLLEQMMGAGPQWAALKARLKTTLAAPAGDYLAGNDTVAGRAQNRGVLIESQRRIDFAPERVCTVLPQQAAAYPLLRWIPNDADHPQDARVEYRLDAKKVIGEVAQDLSRNGNAAHFWVELAHWGVAAGEIFAEGSALVGALSLAAPLLALAGSFMALGAPYAEMAETIAADWSARGYSRGVVMGADGRRSALLKDYFGNDFIPVNPFFDRGKQIATANYRVGLLVGYVHGRLLCPNQRAVFWRDLKNRMSSQTYRGPTKQWSRREWIDWYVTAAAAFGHAHLR